MDNSSVSMNLTACGWPIATVPRHNLDRHDIRHLDLYTYPLLLLIGTLGNLLNIIVLKQEKPCTSKNVYLVAIALSDMLFMWMGFFVYVSNFDGEVHGRPRDSVRAMVRHMGGACHFCQEVATIFSSWLIIAFSVERFMAIRCPLKHLVKDNVRQSWINIAGILPTAIVLASHRLVDYYWYHATAITGSPYKRPDFLDGWNKVYTWLITLINVTTFIIILAVNAKLLREIIRTRKFQQVEFQRSLASHTSSNSSDSTPSNARINPRMEKNALILLGGVVLMFLITQMPVVVHNILHLLEKSCIRRYPVEWRRVAVPVCNFLLNVNYSCNFLVYCSIDKRFRRSVFYLCHAVPRLRYSIAADSRQRHTKNSKKPVPVSHSRPRNTVNAVFSNLSVE
ncbi:neuropeptides capa receptor-like [Paramacrobiotus metropolitanus]|uniref:neuropeptides capa receptor-like n=1 Tax=Paramacrobiotus metropolitanus TaxID=2943436 RepID=UPI0024463AE3|nr:neuropeptides capa receptor-like [Paramacrobiotus metropolitanus]XP_055338528.1 neuropeptides capa receptor-like [Paramacrobiotus metropolitanus]XP_055338529.1 neuropeptides capa receptor-like [Paramacrobiotus metropolitanus]